MCDEGFEWHEKLISAYWCQSSCKACSNGSDGSGAGEHYEEYGEYSTSSAGEYYEEYGDNSTNNTLEAQSTERPVSTTSGDPMTQIVSRGAEEPTRGWLHHVTATTAVLFGGSSELPTVPC